MKQTKSPTLNEALAARGLTTGEAPGTYRKHILRGGEIVFTGTAHDVWEWLRSGMSDRVEKAFQSSELASVTFRRKTIVVMSAVCGWQCIVADRGELYSTGQIESFVEREHAAERAMVLALEMVSALAGRRAA